MQEAEQYLVQVATSLARENPITLQSVQSKLRSEVSGGPTERQLLKAMLRVTTDFRRRGQFGRFRAALLLGTTLLGASFVTAAERTGVLLCDDSSPRSHHLLTQLSVEAGAPDNGGWRFLEARLQTYLAYERLVAATAANESSALRLLGVSPREAIKKVLALTHLRFLSYMDFNVPTNIAEWLKGFGPPEEFATIASLLVALANGQSLLDSIDFAFPLDADIASAEVRDLVEYGKALQQRYEVAKDISLFGYRLEVIEGNRHSRVFNLHPPSPEFEYAIRLGYIRSDLSRSKGLLEAGTVPSGRPVSILGAAEVFATRLRDRISELRDENTPGGRVIVNFPLVPELYRTVLTSGFYEDFLEEENLSLDFIAPLRQRGKPEIQLTENLDLETFVKIWRLMRFLSLVDICAVRSFKDIGPAILFNSVFRVAKEQDLLDLIVSIGISAEEAREFLRLVSADVQHLGYLDLQYRPFLRIAAATLGGYTSPPEIVYVPALVAFANVLRNVQSANQLRLTQNADLLVVAVADVLGRFFEKVTMNRRVKSETEATDIDVAVLEGRTLYLFECKHSVPPTSSHEMRDIWEDIEKAARQLRTALRVLAGPDRLLSYLTGWFPGITREDTMNIRIVPCVLCSHRIFAGMSHENIPIRDFSSLAKLTTDGIVSLGIMENDESVSHRFRVLAGEKFSAADLDNYTSAEPRFFKMFVPFMHPVSRLTSCGNITVARETYVYEVNTHEWIEHMGSLGFVRLDDERRKWTRPWTGEDIAEVLDSDGPVSGDEDAAGAPGSQ